MEEPASDPPAKAADRKGCIAVGALVAAAPFYLMTASIVGFERRNPEDGMLIGFMMIEQVPLWIALATFLAVQVSKANLPQPALIGLWLAVPLAAAVSFMTLGFMGTDPNWMAVAPVLLPLVAVVFGFWAPQTAAAPAAERRGVLLGFAATAIALILVLPIGYGLWGAGEPAREAARVQDENESAARQARWEAGCATLSAESPLETFVELRGLGLCDDKARTLLSDSPRRQREAAQLLDRGALDRMQRLHEYGLAASPVLCRSYRRALERRSDELGQPENAQNQMQFDTEFQTANMNWFMAQGCDLTPQLRRLANVYRTRLNAEMPASGFDIVIANGVGPAPAAAAAD